MDEKIPLKNSQGHRFGYIPEVSNLPKISSLMQKSEEGLSSIQDTRFGHIGDIPQLPTKEGTKEFFGKSKSLLSIKFISLAIVVILLGFFYFNQVSDQSFLQALGFVEEESPAPAPVQAPRPAPVPRSSVPMPAPAPTPPPAPAPVVPFTPTASAAEYAQFENLVPSNELIQKLPSDAEINMIFFNRNRGYWESEKEYKLTKGSITPGQYPEPDFKFVMNARWVSQFTATNFCDIMNQARAASESDAEAFGSKMSLTWKYKGIIGYRNCLGF